MQTYSNIVVLTGAGISAESGIRTFRAQDGLWEDHHIEDVATPEAFDRDPELVQRFYNMRREPLLEKQVAPNNAHFALAKLEKEFSGSVTLITQNIDNLHEQAGSKNAIHMHGEILKMRCRITEKIFSCEQMLTVKDRCACCQQTGNLRPHIVWFGEMPLFMEQIYAALEQCDLFVAIGTSGNVYPAAGFVQIASQVGANSIEMNLEQSNIASQFDEAVYAKATEAVPTWVNGILDKNKPD
ncbi:MAG: NAD-dependent protein deacylase [Acidiferrobacterales bacterium]|nr:NAD-dependent protein deacylase [Acidiferrobacterales bacterium]